MDEFCLNEMRTWGQSKSSSFCFCVWCESRELGGRGSSRFPCVNIVVETSTNKASHLQIHPRAEDQERLKSDYQTDFKTYYKMHRSHLFAIDETSPVNIQWKQKQFFFENLSPSSTLSYTITKKAKKVNLRRKSRWGSWNSWGSLLIALSLNFTVIRFLFRFLFERILFRVLCERVFFESSEIGSPSLGCAAIDSSLHQCSFSAMLLFFIKSCYYCTFFLKNRCFALHSL